MINRRDLLAGSVGAAMATSVAATAADNSTAPQAKDRENPAGQPYDRVALLCLGRSALAARARRDIPC